MTLCCQSNGDGFKHNKQATATPACQKRLAIGFKKSAQNPEKYVIPRLDTKNILHCFFVLLGVPDTPYDAWMYFGSIKLPPDYPFLPPSIEMYRPSWLFEQNKRICNTISDFNPRRITSRTTCTRPSSRCTLS